MAIENARLHEEVQKRDLERGELLRQMYSIQEEERKRIARELHDETTQSLVGMAASLEAISSTLPKAQEPIKRKLKTLQSVSLGVLDEMHRMIYELRPSMLDDFGLVPAVRLLAQKELNPAGIVFDFKVEGREKRIPPRLESTLFRVIQEAMNNIVRHSRAKKSRIILRFQKNKVNVLIADDGTGFDTNEAISPQTRPKGLGLLGMRERVGLVNGVIRIQSESGGGGTEITIEVPLLEAKD